MSEFFPKCCSHQYIYDDGAIFKDLLITIYHTWPAIYIVSKFVLMITARFHYS